MMPPLPPQYRNMMPPLVYNLAFIGAEVATNNNILTHALQVWISQRVTPSGMNSVVWKE